MMTTKKPELNVQAFFMIKYFKKLLVNLKSDFKINSKIYNLTIFNASTLVLHINRSDVFNAFRGMLYSSFMGIW